MAKSSHPRSVNFLGPVAESKDFDAIYEAESMGRGRELNRNRTRQTLFCYKTRRRASHFYNVGQASSLPYQLFPVDRMLEAYATSTTDQPSWTLDNDAKPLVYTIFYSIPFDRANACSKPKPSLAFDT